MKISNLLTATLALSMCASAQITTAVAQNTIGIQSIDQRIGTGGHGHVFLGANVPFGFIQLGPTQHTRGWDWCSGYHTSDSVLVGFSHTHLSGTGIGDLGDITMLPVSNIQQDTCLFTHDKETIRPGYYAVKLDNPQVNVELTATTRAGMHRYTFTGEQQPLIRLDLNTGIGWDSIYASDINCENATTISGLRFSKGWARNQKVYFVATFSRPVKLVKYTEGVAVFSTSKSTDPLLVKVGLSAVSIEGARKNLQTEIPDWNFDTVAMNASKQWQKILEDIHIEGADAQTSKVFATALYHAFTAPSVFSDVDGNYRGADGAIHHGTHTNYTTFSLWDTYRSLMPLMTLVNKPVVKDIAETFIKIYQQQGRLPVWHLMGNETDCMVGNPGVIIMGDMILKGLVNDKETAYQAMKNTMMNGDRSLDLLAKYSYIPYELDPTYETVAKTLEYAIADDAVARVAKYLGHTDDYNYFYNRSKSYRQLFDTKTAFMRGKNVKGEWRLPFNPIRASHRQDDYTEGNAWQYTWLVPQDVHGLVKLFGSEKRFVNKLDSLFTVQGDLGAEASPDISGLIGQYAHGNEPSHHIIYMYHYVGMPWKAAPLLRQVMREMYHDAPDGLCGNEDVGQMSAWYVLSSLGLYQVEPAGGKWLIGSPLFKKSTIKLDHDKQLTIETVNNSDKNIYVQKAEWNGKSLTKSYLTQQQIQQGGTLKLYMGNRPSKWGTAKADRP